MSFQFNATSNTVAITGDITITETEKEVLYACNTTTASNSVTLGTVPAGKKWKILSAFAIINTTTSANNAIANILLNGTAVIIAGTFGLATYGHGAVPVILTWSYDACPVLTAGQTAQLTSSGTGAYKHGGISYVEIDA